MWPNVIWGEMPLGDRIWGRYQHPSKLSQVFLIWAKERETETDLLYSLEGKHIFMNVFFSVCQLMQLKGSWFFFMCINVLRSTWVTQCRFFLIPIYWVLTKPVSLSRVVAALWHYLWERRKPVLYFQVFPHRFLSASPCFHVVFFDGFLPIFFNNSDVNIVP